MDRQNLHAGGFRGARREHLAVAVDQAGHPVGASATGIATFSPSMVVADRRLDMSTITRWRSGWR